MMRFSLATILCTICTDGNVGPRARLWLSKLERAKRWASERAAIKAEVNQAKETVDLLRIAHAITRLDALDAEIEAVKKAESGKSRKTKTSFRATRSMRVKRENQHVYTGGGAGGRGGRGGGGLGLGG
jgi:hypothetical protein